MARALLVVQGINSNPRYLVEDIADFRNIKKTYDEILNAPVERIWNKSWISKIPFVGNKYGDIISFYTNEKARIQASTVVADRIYELQKAGLEVDILAHSLGTVITLCCGPQFHLDRPPVIVRNFYCLNSPIGISIPVVRGKALSHAERFSTNFMANKIYNLYASNDKISSRLDPRNDFRAMNILSKHSVMAVDSRDIRNKHDHYLALDFINRKLVY
jgi:hypothetical protein